MGTLYLSLFKEVGRLTTAQWIEKGQPLSEALRRGFQRADELCPQARRLFYERNHYDLSIETARIKPAKYSMRDKPKAGCARLIASYLLLQGIIVHDEGGAEELFKRADNGEFGTQSIPYWVYAREFSDGKGMVVGTKIGYTGQQLEQRGRELNSHSIYFYDDPGFTHVALCEDDAIRIESRLKEELSRHFKLLHPTHEHFLAPLEMLRPILHTVILNFYRGLR
jgi:Meiotically up-regulated gene 113